MENLTTPSAETVTPICQCCKKPVQESSEFCANCGFPLKGSEEEKGIFIGKYIANMGATDEQAKQIKNARTSLGVIAVLTALGGIIALIGNDEDKTFTFIASVVMAIVFAGLAAWSNQKPFAAVLIGLIIYLSLQILNAVVEPITIVKGLIIKIFIVGYLIKGLVGASKVRENS